MVADAVSAADSTAFCALRCRRGTLAVWRGYTHSDRSILLAQEPIMRFVKRPLFIAIVAVIVAAPMLLTGCSGGSSSSGGGSAKSSSSTGGGDSMSGTFESKDADGSVMTLKFLADHKVH